MIDAKYKTQFYIDETNEATGPVVRWNSNDRIPFPDMLQDFVRAGWIDRLTEANSLDQRRVEDREAIMAYVANYRGPSMEERFEARAAFGPGVKLVDVFSGHEWTT